ncbi:MAG: extracellular solute-binding protein, partial [Nitrososphaerota archaeon]|nr:extracellular solute-binding protein [Nitrososphaerota archaeon]
MTFSALKKIIAMILVVSLALGVLHLSGYINKSGSSEKVVIWAYNYYIDTAKEAVKEYQKTHKNVEFEIVELGQDDFREKFRIALASGNKENLPDIIVDEYYTLKGYLEFYEDYFADLTSYVDPSLYVDFTVKSVTYKDKIWAIPYDTGVGAWFYRVDVLSEAGFSEADVQNITWDRFVEIGKVVKEKTGKYMTPIFPEAQIEGRIMLQSAGSW